MKEMAFGSCGHAASDKPEGAGRAVGGSEGGRDRRRAERGDARALNESGRTTESKTTPFRGTGGTLTPKPAR
jgi:hypothetical protein